ncbi:MAG: hypothetical protein M3357_07020 [Actinomycetota bacterium]|jgi:hypothetical protein|nr:hypothetical protein [Actinomycetota bacterium]
MSTIWTPSGEYVPKPEDEAAPPRPQAPPPGGEPSPEEVEAALAEARAILEHPVLEHVAGHVMGLFELAALHLEREAATGGEEKPDLVETSLAIDAMAALVEGLGERLGRYQQSLNEALSHLRLAYVRAQEGSR